MDNYIFSDEYITQIEKIQEIRPSDEKIKELVNQNDSDIHFLSPNQHTLTEKVANLTVRNIIDLYTRLQNKIKPYCDNLLNN